MKWNGSAGVVLYHSHIRHLFTVVYAFHRLSYIYHTPRYSLAHISTEPTAATLQQNLKMFSFWGIYLLCSEEWKDLVSRESLFPLRWSRRQHACWVEVEYEVDVMDYYLLGHTKGKKEGGLFIRALQNSALTSLSHTWFWPPSKRQCQGSLTFLCLDILRPNTISCPLKGKSKTQD